MDTPRTEEVLAQINNCGGSSEAAFHDMLNHARQLERELSGIVEYRSLIAAAPDLLAALEALYLSLIHI